VAVWDLSEYRLARVAGPERLYRLMVDVRTDF
jgi:hypothetical protein